MGRLRFIKPFLKKYKWHYLFGLFWLLLVNIIQLIIPRILGNLSDGLAEGILEYSGLLRYVVIILVLALIIAISRFMWRIYIIGTSRRLEYFLRNRLVEHLQKLSPEYFNHHKTGDLMAHATNDINAIRMAFGPGIIMITDALVISIITIFLMINQVGWQLTLIALIPLPFLATGAGIFGRVIHKRFKKVQEAFSNLTDKVQENLSGIRVVKAFVQEQAEIKKFNEASQHHVNMNMRLIAIWGALFPLIQVIATLSMILILFYGGRAVIYGIISIGDFVAFNSYLGLMIWPMMAIGWVINVIQRGTASLDRVNEILLEKPDITDAPDAIDLDIQGEIEFKNLTFGYVKGIPVLKNINLKIEKGKTLAIIGRTGSGKTTLVNLLLRLANPPKGTLFIDGVDINKIKLKSLRENIGYVPQDNFLFSTTIEENIAFGLREYTKEQVEEAAKIAQVYDNIMDFPDKFNTMLGERGVTLSGGQKQRVSIARAIIKEPAILILDDSLSAVDTHTEEEILKGLRKIMAERTSIIISHRVSTVKEADEIVVMDDGEIVERGTHDQLVALGGLYYQLHIKQLLEEKVNLA
ncbi:ATP-binding cassette, subfamily B [Anaerobranca californiensis DSM 14826]|uniref:ATP-binding cassette, subfamily B n=1 Tax=Anaerobranca californiensis DSM 14826 TaxID=1120989 RepID=A0A1M6NZN6_9FIRM|nr:ABC transporter ATP-binding protein [Anaerobranca californiensis]SHK01187.1 ATP-binding cassette, subfamily B [Anaerobranca californiensis DSM 14826]